MTQFIFESAMVDVLAFKRTNLSRWEELGTKPVGLLVVHVALIFPNSIGIWIILALIGNAGL